MPKQQIVKGPFIGLLILSLLYLVYGICAIIFSTSEAFIVLIFPVLFFIESFVYWRIRKKVGNKTIAWAHVLLLVIGFLVITLFVFLTTYFDINYILTSEDKVLPRLATFIFNYGFWITFVLAHIFFVITIVKSFSKKQEVEMVEPTPGLLDELAE